MNWTPEQLEAIETHGSNIIVSAGAGSGKTAVLTERTIRNLKHFSIKEMIILTFTNAAAFSMKSKIKKAIKKSDDEVLKENLKYLESASICTFDSFSLDLVKKYSDLLNISPDIGIADSVVVSSLKESVIDEVFEDFYNNQKFLEFLDTYTVKDDLSIRNDVKEILNNLDKLYDPVKYLDNYFNEFNSLKYDEFIQEYIDLLDNKYSELKVKYNELVNLVTNDKEEKFVNSLNSYMGFKSFEEYILFHNYNIRSNKSYNDELKSKYGEFKAIVDELKELAIYSSREEIKEELEEANKYNLVIINLLRTIITRLNNYKKENNLYEFKDITRLAIKLLEENQDIREYYKNNIKEIMIDEYQDTNDLAEYLVSLISNNNVFMVGDVKQSIYRFNNANPDIFIKKYNDYSKNIGGIKIDLNRNFRCRTEVKDNVNLIFSKIMTENIGGAEYQKDHQMVFGHPDYKEDSKYNMQILNYNMDDYEGFKNDEVEPFIVARDIKDKFDNHYQIFDEDKKCFRDFTYSDATILLATKTEFDLYKKVFDYFNIPLTIHKEEDLTYSTELIVIKNIVKLVGYYKGINLDNELNKTYMSVARSFILNMSDKDIFKVFLASKNGNLFDYIDKDLLDKIVYLSNFIDDHSIFEFVEEILDIFDIYMKIGTIGDQEIICSKIDHLINSTISLENMGYHLEEFIEYLNNTADEKIDFSLSSDKRMDVGVNIMTIHKSKGLDFKICYFADLKRKFSLREIKGRFLFSSKYGFIFPVINEGIKSTILKELLKEEYMKEEISERIRLFYVALTRTKEQMIFVASLDDKEEHYDIVPDSIRMKYSNFKGFLESIKYYLNKYIIDVPKIEIDRNYEKFNLKEITTNNNSYKTIDINIEKTKVSEGKFSHSVSELKDNSLLEEGTKIHECLEYIDFSDFDNSLSMLDISDFMKNKIKSIKNQPFIVDNAIYHKEYEFIYNDNRGIIDLLVESEDKLIVVDYKLSEINKDYYFDQVRGYMNYLKNASNKEVEGYLYSIINGDIIKVELI